MSAPEHFNEMLDLHDQWFEHMRVVLDEWHDLQPEDESRANYALATLISNMVHNTMGSGEDGAMFLLKIAADCLTPPDRVDKL